MKVEWGVSLQTMVEVNTLYKTCLKHIVEQNLLSHPVDIRNHIPQIIYEDLWNVQSIKNFQQVERGLYSSIAYLESQYEDVEPFYAEYANMWEIACSEMHRINAAYPDDRNPPNPPPMMFFRLYQKYLDYDQMLDVFDEWIDKKWELVEEFSEEKEKLITQYGDFDFKIESIFIAKEEDDHLFAERMESLHRSLDENRVVIYEEEE